MNDELLEYYNRELTYLRRMGAEFGRQYPGVASALQLDATRSDDPHVERLLEGFAFLAARVHLRIDDDFPEITQGLLDTLYPDYARPVPSMSLVQFQLDPEQGKLTTGFHVPAQSQLYSRAVNGVRCQFRTCYDTTVWPIQVTAVEWASPHKLDPPVRAADAVAALRVELRATADVRFSDLDLDRLRLYISAESDIAATLYELLGNSCGRIIVRAPGRSGPDAATLPGSALVPVGFELDEGVLPVPRRSHAGFRLLTEYFTFPEKFYFFDLTGLDAIRAGGFDHTVELVFLISRFELADRGARLERAVNADTIRLGCTPIINLFPHTAEPVLLTQRRPEYAITPDARRRDAIGIHSVVEVNAVTAARAETVRFEPLYSYRHQSRAHATQPYWKATRRPRGWRADEASDVFLSFVDAEAIAAHPDFDTVTARLLCHNADLPSRLQIGDPEGDFEMPGGGPIRAISALINPTQLIPARAHGPLLWRLVSLLSLNFVSLVDNGPAALQELLGLHNLRGSPACMKQIEAITTLRAGPSYSRINGDHGLAFARGCRIDIELDEEQFAGGGVYLFGSLLERFFGMYASLNSFTVLRMRSRRRKEIVKEWPPRAGLKALV